MGKPHGQGRHAALRLAVAGLRTVQLSILLAGVLLAWCPCAMALDAALDVSQYAHTAWKVREGFAKGAISSIAQTADGYLWLGTEFGLLRFDGVRAVSWQPPPGQHLPSDFIMSLLVTRDGTLWIGTLKGLASWKDGKLTQYTELDGRYIYALAEDREGTVWASGYAVTTGRLCAIRRGGVECDGDNGVLGRGVFNLYEDSKGNLWAGVKDGLWRWRPAPAKFYQLPDEPNGIQALGEDTGGTLLVGWKGGIYRFVEGKTEAYPVSGIRQQFRAHRMLRDHDGGLWIATERQGLVHVHEGRADAFTQSDSLSGGEVAALFGDREGSIWVATTGGLDRFREFAVATFTVKQGLADQNVGFALAARDGSVWLATLAGLNRWTNGQITSFGKRDGTLHGYFPISVFQDSRGRIWVSTTEGGGYLENERFSPISGVPGGPVHGTAEDTAGSLWIANQEQGLLRLVGDRLAEKIPWAQLGHKDIASALIADPVQGGLWLGFLYGGVAYFKDGRIRTAYAGSDGLDEGRVNTLRVDADGALWAATDGGLSRLKNGRIATLTSKNGLPCDAVHWSMQDDAGSVWLYMPCGLVRIARAELVEWAAAADKDKSGDAKRIQATVFDNSDGVRTHGAGGGYGALVAKASDGKLWFLPFDGVSVIDPRHLPFNKLPPPVYVEQITADRKTYDASLVANGNAKGHLPLPALIRDLEIDYNALSLVVPEKVRFRYKLEGRDRDWQDAGNRRQAFYTDLPPRNYRFRVVACNNSGVWNETGAFLDFSVAPAYYQTTWFRLSCVAALVVLLWALYQLRLRQVARQFNMRLEERVGERTRIARELHDTLLQSFQGLLLRFQTVSNLLPGGEPKQKLDDAIDQVAQAITEGRDAVQGLRSSTTVTNDLACAITTLGQELAVGKSNPNAAEFHVEVEGTTRDLHPILRDEVYRIAGEAVRNAFKHAQAQLIEVEIRYDERQLRVRVRDDGKGIDAKVLGGDGRAGHFGLHGMSERAKLMGGKLAVWSELDSGTEVELSIPASRAYQTLATRRRPWLAEKLSGKETEMKS
jgi:signal transduction histidine kinase/ligand-binding sensor domain-containing protein